MAKADTDDRDAGGNARAQKDLERLDPRQAVVDAVARARDEPGIGLRRRGGHLARDHPHSHEVERRVHTGEQPFEHGRIVAVEGLQFRSNFARFKDTDLHPAALPIFRPK